MSRVFTVRLHDDQVAELTSLATFDNVAIAEEIREAIVLLLKSRSKDPNFIRRVKGVYENAKQVLAGLERGQELIDALGDPIAQAAASQKRAVAIRSSRPQTSTVKQPAATQSKSYPTRRVRSSQAG
jgi:hypothetical protein